MKGIMAWPALFAAACAAACAVACAIACAIAFCTPPAFALAPGDVLWMAPIQGEGWACPTVGPDGMTVYYGTHKDGAKLYKVDGAAGAILDSAFVRGIVEHSVALSHDGRLYVPMLPVQSLPPGNPYAPTPGISCFSASDLSEIWFRRISGPGSDNSPVLGFPQHPDRVYLGMVASPSAPASVSCPNRHFYGLDAGTGEIVMDVPTEGWQATPGAVDPDGHIYFGCGDIREYCDTGVPPAGVEPGAFHVLAGGDDGSHSWPVFYAEGEFGSPVAWADGVAYTACRDGLFRGFRASDGVIVFQFDLGARSWSGTTIGIHPINGHKILYLGTQNQPLGPPGGERTFYAIEDDGTPDGLLLWSTQVGGGFAFGNAAIDDLGNVYFTTSAGVLHATTWDGQSLWQRSLPGAGGPAPLGGIGGPTILDDGTIVSGSNGGFLVAFRGSGNHLNDRVPWPKYKHDLRNTGNVLAPIRDSAPAGVPGAGVPGAGAGAPPRVTLSAPSPNPFRARTSIGLTLAHPGRAAVALVDAAGREVRRLDLGFLAAGETRRLEIDGAGLPSGLYILRITTGDEATAAEKLLLVR